MNTVGFLGKGFSLLAGIVGVSVGGSKGFGSGFQFPNVDEITKIDFSNEDTDGKLHELFKDGYCIQKYLPEMESNLKGGTPMNGSALGIEISTKGFSGAGDKSRYYEGFRGTMGCLDARIKYNDDSESKGIAGNIELIAWNKDYGMVIRSIISGLSKDIKFLNQLTILEKDQDIWKIQNSIIWFDSVASSNSGDKKIKLKFGEEQIFEIDLSSSTSPIDSSKLVKKYEKLALWTQGQKGVDTGKLLGNLSIDIGNKNTDLWTTMDKMLQEQNNSGLNFAAKLFHTGTRWYKVDKFPNYHKFFNAFDTYNPGLQDESDTNIKNNGKNHLSVHGKWSTI